MVLLIASSSNTAFSSMFAAFAAAFSVAASQFTLALSCSLIVLITSLIIESGVDAPATTPTIISLFLNISREISHSFAALRVFLQFFSQIFLSFWVLELCLSPKTSITSHFLLNSSAPRCRSNVVLHMLLNTRMRGYSRSITRCIAANVSESNVV